MQKTIFELKKVELHEFNPKDSLTRLRIEYLKDSQPREIIESLDLSNPVNVVNKLLLKIKSQDKIIIEESDDFLQNIYITRIKDEDEVEEKLLKYFQDLNKHLKELKSQKTASIYMQLYNKLKTSKLIL